VILASPLQPSPHFSATHPASMLPIESAAINAYGRLESFI
jgi:hypothetical protein